MVETSESKRAKKQLAEMETVSSGLGSTGLYRFKKQAKRGGDWSIKGIQKRIHSVCYAEGRRRYLIKQFNFLA